MDKSRSNLFNIEKRISNVFDKIHPHPDTQAKNHQIDHAILKHLVIGSLCLVGLAMFLLFVMGMYR